MLSGVNGAVQALIWTTLAGLLYAVWLHSRATAQGHSFDPSAHWRPILHALQTMWTALVISLILALLLAVLFPLYQVARSASTTCVPSSTSTLTLADGDSSTALVCAYGDAASR